MSDSGDSLFMPKKVDHTAGPEVLWSVAYHPDGVHIYDGTTAGIRRRRVSDGCVVGKLLGLDVFVMSPSKDGKWVVCGCTDGAAVLDAEFHAPNFVFVEDGNSVFATNFAPDCTRFATGTELGDVNVWNLGGDLLVGPIEHGGDVTGLQFSPDGERLATACKEDVRIRILDSRNGDLLLSIRNPLPDFTITLPMNWSNDGTKIFAACIQDYKIKCFDAFSGHELAQWHVPENDPSVLAQISLALSPDDRFVAVVAGPFLSFWDTELHVRLGSNVTTQGIRAISMSPDSRRLASVSFYSDKISIWDIADLPTAENVIATQPKQNEGSDNDDA